MEFLPLTKSRSSMMRKDSDSFGNLSDSRPIWCPDLKQEPQKFTDESDNSVIIRSIDEKYKCAKKYLTEMKLLVKEKKLKDALDLFLDMKRNFVKPVHGNYTYMIGACGRAGYTEMAFKLLRQMTDYGFRPTSATLTGLFNSCAECPDPEYGLKKANLLREKIEQKNWQLTQVTYHSMIKAYGKCEDLQMAFQIADEMAKEHIPIDVVTYSFLLMSCVADKEAGFTHAIEVWRKMIAKRCTPNLFTCNLLLRAARDCGIGPDEVSCLLLQHWSSYLRRPYGLGIEQISSKEKLLRITSPQNSVIDDVEQEPSTVKNTESALDDALNRDAVENETGNGTECEDKNMDEMILKETTVMSSVENIPSLLQNRPMNGSDCISLINIKHRSDRLALIGGVDGFLDSMMKNKIKPSIKTFTLLLQNLPPNNESEEQLLSLLDTYKVKPDIGFFNILIKRRNVRKEIHSGKKVLLLINKYGLCPDIATFGVLAVGCLSRNLALYLLNDMMKLGICPNIEIIGAFVHNASKVLDFQYLEDVLKLMANKDILPNEQVLRKLEETVHCARRNIIDMEHCKDVDMEYKTKNFTQRYNIFCTYYSEWLQNMGIELSEHPWDQYKTNITEKIIQEDYVQ